MTSKAAPRLPKRIILIRHGESLANIYSQVYDVVPNHKIPLTDKGKAQAQEAGEKMVKVITDNGKVSNWKAFFYVSPYVRTKETLHEIAPAFPKDKVVGVREDCSIREQDFGNFQDHTKMDQYQDERHNYGKFFYRFPAGESAADVYDRVSNFLESLWRDINMDRIPHSSSEELNVIIVAHGLAVQVFLMRWFKWRTEQFEELKNLANAEFRVMELGNGGEYSLYFHHKEEELKKWGLSDEMIEDQKNLAHGGPSVKVETGFFTTFFDRLAI